LLTANSEPSDVGDSRIEELNGMSRADCESDSNSEDQDIDGLVGIITEAVAQSGDLIEEMNSAADDESLVEALENSVGEGK
jgi:hypothetical protein